MHACKHRSKNLACTLCSCTLEQARDKFDTVLKSVQIGDEDPAIKYRYVHAHKNRSQNLVGTLCSSSLEQATDKSEIVFQFWLSSDQTCFILFPDELNYSKYDYVFLFF